MVVVPVDPEVDEAQDVDQEDRGERFERRQICFVRRLELEHHDRDENRDDAVAERLEPVLRHVGRASVAAVGHASIHPFGWSFRSPSAGRPAVSKHVIASP
jgi:hypothetical protein